MTHSADPYLRVCLVLIKHFKLLLVLSGCGGTKLLFNNRGPGHYKLQVTSGGRKKLPLTVCVSQSLSSDEEGLGLKYLKTNESSRF